MENSREAVESEYNTMVFDYFIDQHQNGLISFEEAIWAYKEVAAKNLGSVAVANS